MAVTKIWKVKNNLNYVVDYAKDPSKTKNPEFENEYFQTMRDVMDYAIDNSKTEKQYYVSGINCSKELAREEMAAVKVRFNKKDGILAWHGYQSFMEGEVSPETAHEIGVKLAKELWSDFQVVVATHLNTNCCHNHFVVNSVSFKTGKKFYGNKASYKKMRDTSDRLCKEYGLSVIQNFSEIDHTKQYYEWKAEQEGRRTWRSAIKEDVDKAISLSISFLGFVRYMREMGYEFKTGVKHIAVRPKGKERFVRLRSLGENYTEEEIRNRILKQQRIEKRADPPKVRKARFIGSFALTRRISWNSIRGLYYYFLHKLRKARDNPNDLYLIRDELRNMDKLSEQAKFLNTHNLDTAEQVADYMESQLKQIHILCRKRKKLRDEIRRVGKSEVEVDLIKEKKKGLSDSIKSLRKEVKLCDDIQKRSKELKEKLDIIREEQQKMLEKDNIKGKQTGSIERKRKES